MSFFGPPNLIEGSRYQTRRGSFGLGLILVLSVLFPEQRAWSQSIPAQSKEPSATNPAPPASESSDTKTVNKGTSDDRFSATTRRVEVQYDPCIDVPENLLQATFKGELQRAVEIDSVSNAPLANATPNDAAPDKPASAETRPSAGQSAPLVLVVLTCIPPQELRIEVQNLTTGRRIRRGLLRSETTPLERARLLALVSAEAIDSSGQTFEATVDESKDQVDVSTEVQDLSRLETPVNGAQWEWTLLLARRMGLSANPAMWGGQIGIGRELGSIWSWQAQLEGLAGATQVSLGSGEVGQVQTQAYSVAARFEASGGRAQWRPLMGIGVRAGLGYFSSRSSSAAFERQPSAWSPWWGPTLSTSLVWAPWRWVALKVDVELGWAALGIETRAEDQELVAGLHGFWLTPTLGITGRF